MDDLPVPSTTANLVLVSLAHDLRSLSPAETSLDSHSGFLDDILPIWKEVTESCLINLRAFVREPGPRSESPSSKTAFRQVRSCVTHSYREACRILPAGKCSF